MRTYPGIIIPIIMEFVLYNYDYISSMLIVHGNLMFGMPAKYIILVVGVEYYNHSFNSGHQEFPIIHHELHVSASLNSRHVAHS